MFTKKLLAASIALGLGISGVAQADFFAFDPNGTGALVNTTAAVVDEAPGSLLSVGAVIGIGTPGTPFSALYQANLSAIQDSSSLNLFSNGTGGKFFTFAAVIPEVIQTTTFNSSTASATFEINNGPLGTMPQTAVSDTNRFRMYATTALGNNLAGTGFTTGIDIFEAYATESASSFGYTTGSPTTSCPTAVNLSGFGGPANLTSGNLDQSPNGNQWGAQQTLCGTGSTDLTLHVTYADPNYFPNLFTGATFVFHFANTSQIDPFLQVDPSKLFSSNAILDGNEAAVLGARNGGFGQACAAHGPGSTTTVTGCDFIFQADANGSFKRTIPEPASLGLLGLGLAAMGAFGRRQKT